MKNIPAFAVLSFLLFPSIVSAQTPAVEIKTYDQLVKAIRETRAASEERIEKAVDAEKVKEAWEIGNLIKEHILLNKERADYGEQVMARLADDLDVSKSELHRMVEFARAYPIAAPARQLSWSHYRELLSLNDEKEREALTQKALQENWGRDQLREEVRKRKQRAEAKEKPLEAKPGKLNTYRIIKAPFGKYKDRLVVDLGFSSYYKPVGELPFREGDIVRLSAVSGQLSAFADRGKPTAESSLWTYKAHVIEVVDGDTIHVSVDLGFGFTMNQTLRLRGLDAPEIKSSDGKASKEFLRNLVGQTQTLLIKTSKSDKYDRYLADIWANQTYVNQELLKNGLAAAMKD
jgi:endonuclease YncB( thermonuclease family)